MSRSLHIRQTPSRGGEDSRGVPLPSLLAGFPPFAHLPREAQEDLEAALVPVRYGPGSVIIREGDAGDSFFLIRSGRVEVTGKGREGEDLVFARLEAGEGFGEVALLTRAPRTATVRAVGEVELARLDRETFERVLSGHAEVGLLFQERVQTIGLATFLKKATPFAKLPDRALRAVMARMRREEHPAGAVILRQGEPGTTFYIVRSGRAEVLVEGPDGAPESKALLGEGDCFGEEALLTGNPRSATIRAVEPVRLLTLEKEDFQKALEASGVFRSYFGQVLYQRQRPLCAPGIQVHREEGRKGHPSYYVLSNLPLGAYFRLTEAGYFLWERMDGYHTMRDLLVAYFQRFGKLGAGAVFGLVGKLREGGFVLLHQEEEALRLQQVQGPLLGLARRVFKALSWVVEIKKVDPWAAFLYRWAGWPFFTRAAGYLYPVVVFLGLATLGYAWWMLKPDLDRLFLGVVAGAIVVHGLLHELAHALAVKAVGRRVLGAGFGLFWGAPILFINTSDVWTVDRWKRILVSWAGPYINLILGAATALAIPWVENPWTQMALFQASLVGVLICLHNLNPLLEFDGYYILMDYLEIPALRQKAFDYVGERLLRQGRRRRPRREARIFAVFGVLSVGFLLFTLAQLVWIWHVFAMKHLVPVVGPDGATLLGWGISLALTGVMFLPVFQQLGLLRGRQTAEA